MNIKYFIAKHLWIIHKGTILGKTKSTAILALAGSPFVWLFENLSKWSVENAVYIQFVLGAIVVDHILGSVVHAWYKRDFSVKKNIFGVLKKLGMVVAMGYLFEGMHTLSGGDTIVADYLKIVLRLTVFIYPAGSASVNCSIITNGAFPPLSWLNKVKNFNKDMDLRHFEQKEHTNYENIGDE